MCTVSYIPYRNGFVLTSNRDETPLRAKTAFPEKLNALGENVLFPKDPQGNGSWIAFSETRLICLLNGAKEKHKRQPPYRKSRGLVVLERFLEGKIEDFFEKVDLQNIEPFTIVSVDNHKEEKQIKLAEIIWDGKEKQINYKDQYQSHIWSSATLYNAEQQVNRKICFEEANLIAPETVLQFHQQGAHYLGPENQIKMKRANVETISTTQVTSDNHFLSIKYINYVSEETTNLKINKL